MGSCASTPSRDAITCDSTSIKIKETAAMGISATARLSHNSSKKSVEATPDKLLNSQKKQSIKEIKGESESEEIDTKSDTIDTDTGFAPIDQRSSQTRQIHLDQLENGDDDPPVMTQVPRLRVGYSSGGSSEYSDDSESPSINSSGNHLAELKHSLSIDGSLCKGVVRIETDYGRPIEEIYEGVHDGFVLGSGVAGIVRRVKHRKTGVNYAVKCLDLGLVKDESGLQALRDEVEIMCQLDHPNIVRLEEVYENESEIFLIQELCTGGDLFDRLDEQSNFHYSEAKCAKLVKQMLSSVRYLHSKKIIHRDLKLENFLFSSTNPESELKMIDFGLSKHFTHAGEKQNECVGTPYTVAPEILVSEYNEKVDIWALGVITYLLLSGETPFGGIDGESLMEVRQCILAAKCTFEPAEIWGNVSQDGKNFVKRLLNPDSTSRPTAKEAQRDPWIQTFGKRGTQLGQTLSPSLCQALIEFKEYSDIRKVLCEVLSFTLLPEQIADLRQEFEKADPDGEGEISFETLKQVLVGSAEERALGSLTEHEVKGIFNALRVRKTETKIRWHEFIAAGLSLCNFDERNLKLAFDRLDFDRKGFITFDDMKSVLGTADDEEEAVRQMWQDGLAEHVCSVGRITYSDFRRFIKGQPTRDQVPISPRRKSKTLLLETGILESVPEGTISPQGKSPNSSRLDESSLLKGLRLPKLGEVESCSNEKPVEMVIHPPSAMAPLSANTRSQSLGKTNDIWSIGDCTESETKRRASFQVLPSKAIIALQDVIEDESSRNLAINKALYRKHREFRQSVLIASKLFDQKQKARKVQRAKTETTSRATQTRASLIMRRGSALVRKDESSPTLLRMASELDCLRSHSSHTERGTSEQNHVVYATTPDRNKIVAAAAKRSGRPRRPRQKTTSDLSGMLQ